MQQLKRCNLILILIQACKYDRDLTEQAHLAANASRPGRPVATKASPPAEGNDCAIGGAV